MSIDDRNIYFVYGNHGDSPVQLEDYFYFLKEFFQYCMEKTLLASEAPIPGHINILIEYFNEKFITDLRRLKETYPNTIYICIATEFRTGETFNSFFDVPNALKRSSYSLVNSFRRRGVAIAKKLPIYKELRDFYRKMIPESIRKTGSAHYTINFKYWKKRYDYFLKALPLLDMIWLVNESQNIGYQSIIDPRKLWNLPIIPYTDRIPERLSANSCHPDIDFLFTGTLTPYRFRILQNLREKGFTVVNGFFSSFVTDSYIERAKICLHIKPHENWPFTSNMRLHRLLMSGKYVISEAFDKKENEMIQRDFIAEFPSDTLLDFAAKKVIDKEIVTVGIKAREQYIKATEANRQEVRSEIKKMFGFECVNS